MSPWYNHTGWLGVKHQLTYCVSVSVHLWWLVCLGEHVCLCAHVVACTSVCVCFTPPPPFPSPSQMNGNIKMSFTTVQKSFWWWHGQCSVMCVSLFLHLLGSHYPPGVPPSSPTRSTPLFPHLLGSHTPPGVPHSSPTSWDPIPHQEYLPLPHQEYPPLPPPPGISYPTRSTSLFPTRSTSLFPTWDLIPHQEYLPLPHQEYLPLPHQEYPPLPLPPWISSPTRSTSPETPQSRTSLTRPALPHLATPVFLQKTSDRGRVS